MSSDNLTNNLDDHALLLQLVSLFQDFDIRRSGMDESFIARLGSLDGRLGSLDARLGSLDGRLGSLEGRIGSLEVRLEALEQKVDERLYDTRPMWEAVQIQISELRESTEKGFRKLDSKWEMLAREVRDLYADEREVERRLGNLESKVS